MQDMTHELSHACLDKRDTISEKSTVPVYARQLVANRNKISIDALRGAWAEHYSDSAMYTASIEVFVKLLSMAEYPVRTRVLADILAQIVGGCGRRELNGCKICILVQRKPMKKIIALAALTVAFAAAVTAIPAFAADPDLARSKNCMSCHSVANKVVGPAFKDVAKRYAGQPDVEAKLTQKILKGGSGSWGVVPMPANAQVSAAEAKSLAQWILSLK